MKTLDYESLDPQVARRPPRSVARLVRDAMIALCCVWGGPILLGLIALGPDDKALGWVFVPVPISLLTDAPPDTFPAVYVIVAVTVMVWVNHRAFDVLVAVASLVNAGVFIGLIRHGMG